MTVAPAALSVIVPCRDESGCIPRFPSELLAPLDALGLAYEVIAVDDGSQDGPIAALRSLAVRYRPFKVVVHERACGLGAALRAGFSEASGEWIATLDADLTFHPSLIRVLLARQKETGADLVAGSHFLTAGGSAQVPWRRRLPSLAVNACYRLLFGKKLTAYTSIFRLYRASVLKSLPLESSGFEINAEIAARFIQAGRRVAEAPAVLTVRTAGESKLDALRELRRHISLMGRLWRSPS